jgi:phospholipase C
MRTGLSAAMAALFISLLTACTGLTGNDRNGSPIPSGAINHIVIMFQENRSFDSYFGQLTAYRQRNGIPIVSSDGKINDFSAGSFSNTVAQVGVIPVYHTGSVCTEDLSSDWAESHKEMNLQNPAAAGPNAPMDGFAQTAFDLGQFALTLGVTLTDQTGRRAMGFFDDSDLNYYYFMAANFAIGDAFFSPMPGRTAPNRLYIHAATSQGHAHDPTQQLSAKTIWQELDAAGVSWKIYITDNPPNFTYLSQFVFFDAPGTAAHIVPLSQYFTDVQNGTVPAVAFIETGQFSGRDEHPSNFNPANPTQPDHINVQAGAQFASAIINALMKSPSWKDSVFFWTLDEGGGMFDHVPPLSVPSPDGIRPQDLKPDDPAGDFTITGFRVPNIVISPFARKNYVSHTPMDYTAILKFIEVRYNLPSLTRRDASMPDMSEFFDFTGGGPWAIPPSPPVQSVGGVCDFTRE